MAIDQNHPNPSPELAAKPAIDNEFPTYRAISSTAVLSLIFGLASVFCYASLWFLCLVAAAVALGLYSLRKISQLPEVLTGAGLARVGIGIGLLFGLTSVTRAVTEEFTVNYDASKFAREYIKVLKEQPVSMSLYYQQSAEYRKANSPDEMVDQMKKNRSQLGGDAYQQAAKPVLDIKERLDGGKGGDLVFDQIESKAIDGLTVYANALARLDLKGSKEHPEKEAFALIRMVKASDEWLVKEITFPYTPRSVVAAAEQKGDEHGHAH